MTREKQVSELLMHWEDRQKQGDPVSPEELCADCPELLEELKRRIEMVKAMNPVLEMTPRPGDATITYDDQPSKPKPKELPNIPGYEILSELTPGGMGVVYKVANLKVKSRPEALKMIRPQAKLNIHLLQRFKVEIDAIAQFEDPRIVRIYTTGEHDGQPFFTMEFIKGGSLADHLARFQANQKGAVQLLAKVARAVHFMHTREKKIIHRDLKPGNILLKDQDEPVVSDFGLAKFFDQETEQVGTEQPNTDSQLTQAGAVLGTTYYMSPEQAAGKALNERTDIWALGVILYELLTGKRPFVGKNNEEIRKAILKCELARPRQLSRKIDKHLESICLKCLATDPAQRYPSSETLAKELENWRPPGLLPMFQRHPTLSTATFLFIFFAILIGGIILASWQRAPNSVLEKPEKQLPPPIVLIGEKGSPEKSHWLLGGKEAILGEPDIDGPFSFQTNRLSLLELLPVPPWEEFRLEAEICHEKKSKGRGGLFFGYGKKPSLNANYHCFWNLGFADFGGLGGKVNLACGRYHDLPPYLFSEPSAINHLFPPAFQKGELVWRKIAVEVTAQEIRAYWDKKCFGTSLMARIQSMSASILEGIPGPKGHFPFGGSVGIFLDNGAARFRNVLLKPLP